MKRSTYKDVVLAVSLSNLCFLRVWGKLLYQEWYYYQTKYISPLVITAALANVLILAIVLLFGIRWARRTTSAKARVLAEFVFLGLFAMVLNGLRIHAPQLTSPVLIPMIGLGKLVVLSCALAALGVFVVARFRRQTFRFAVACILAAAPFTLVTFGKALQRRAQLVDAIETRTRELASPEAERVRAHPEQGGRVLWVIFDELDYRMAFESRPDSVKLPAFDRFSSESVFLTNAYSPSESTLVSVPSSLSGKRFLDTHPIGPSRLAVVLPDGKQVDWSTQPNVIRQASEDGYNVAIAGWAHPYCRLFAGDLVECHRYGSSPRDARERTFRDFLVKQQIDLIDTIPAFRPIRSFVGSRLGWDAIVWRDFESGVERHREIARMLHQDARRIVSDPKHDLMFIHFPVPHSPFIYDRAAGDYRRDGQQGTYLDNLALADRIFGELRASMEEAGLWEQTTVILTSDHCWRANTFDHKKDRRVPFVIKVAGERATARRYARRFETARTGELASKLLRREIESERELLRWLDRG